MKNTHEAADQHLNLPDGRRLFTRHISPDDTHLLSEMGKLCTAQDLRFRFLHAVGQGNEKALRQLTELDPEREFALVAFESLDSIPLAVVRLHADHSGRTAEFAILVRSDQQGSGLGRALMRRMISCARERNLRVVKGQVLSENDRMLSLSASLGFSRTTESYGVIDISLDLDPASSAAHVLPLPDLAFDTVA